MQRLVLTICFALIASAAELKLGKPLALKKPTPIEKLLAKPGDYVGKQVQVKGRISEVCQMMGCWMVLTNSEGAAIRLEVEDGVIVFPKDSAGKSAVAEGRFTKTELSKDEAIAQARHEAEDAGRPFNPSSVKGPVAIYSIHGSGAVIQD